MQVFKISLSEHYPFLGEDGKKPYADVYLPYNIEEMEDKNKIRPTVVVCPGGAYKYCSEREAEPVALKFLAMGFNVFILNYSTAPHRYPSALIEVAALFDLIHKNADEYHCDASKIGIIGFSAGGHLAAHYSNLYDCEEIKKHFCNTYKPAFCALGYAVLSTTDAHRGSFENLLGHFPETEEEINLFSCEKLVSSKTPQTFLFHTTGDACVPVQNAVHYARALADNNIKFELHIYPDGYHGMSTCDRLSRDNVSKDAKYVGAWITELKRWLYRILDL
ncbi:MAG TPA: acetylesterase [Ruminococcaceae bacterium]|nr:acetylesterase [Oscillospiraceae bacterium]